MNIDKLIDFANSAQETVGRYTRDFTLAPDSIIAVDCALEKLDWHFINYGDEEIDKVPADRRGIYAFAIHHPSSLLPPHGYILYIGIAGKNSKRSLQARYRDYLNQSIARKRPSIAMMIGNWHKVLKFFFAPVGDEVSSDDLKQIEIELNSALMPPFSVGDLKAELRAKRKAF